MDKQKSFSKTQGSAPHDDKSASRSCGGNSGKHGMKASTGTKGNKVHASSTPGIG